MRKLLTLIFTNLYSIALWRLINPFTWKRCWTTSTITSTCWFFKVYISFPWFQVQDFSQSINVSFPHYSSIIVSRPGLITLIISFIYSEFYMVLSKFQRFFLPYNQNKIFPTSLYFLFFLSQFSHLSCIILHKSS